MKKIMAVCEPEKEYAVRFMEYMSGSCSLPFEIQMFTDTDALIGYGAKHDIELLLIGEKALDERTAEIKAGKVIVLRDGSTESVRDLMEDEDVPSVYKYQPARMIVREVMDCYSAERLADSPPEVVKGAGRKIGVISPSFPSLKTVFAITLGEILSAGKPAVYFNLDPFPEVSFSSLPFAGGDSSRTLSDLLYYFRQGKEGLIYQTAGSTERINGLEIVLPVSEPEDLSDMSGAEWRRFFDGIQKTGTYRDIILDIGSGLPGVWDIADSCDVVFMPVGDRENPCEGCRLMADWLRGKGMEPDKIRMVRISAEGTGGEGELFFERQLQGQMGKVIRENIESGKWYGDRIRAGEEI